MKAMKLTLAVGILLVSTSPAFSHFVKAALGFRLGYSPTEQGYGQKGYGIDTKKAVGVQMLSGVNNGGWQGGLKASGSGYGVTAGEGRSLGGGPLDAHVGHGAVKHLRILGLNLYLGGRAGHGLGHGISHKPPLIKKPIFNLLQHHQHQHHQQHHHQSQHQHHQHQPYLTPLEALTKPISLGAGVGAGLKPVIAHAPNGGKIIGGTGGVRAAVGTPGFGLGFNLGYKQGINTKSPLGYVFGLGGPGKYYAPIQKGPIYKGQDQVYYPGGGLLKGHGQDLSGLAHNSYTGAFPNTLDNSFVAGLESKQHFSTHPMPVASNTPTQPQHAQASHHSRQSLPPPAKHQGLQGPFSRPSSYPRNPFLALLQGRPSILRPTPLQYNFNSPQALPSGPYRMVLSPHPPTPAPQRPRSAVPNDGPAPGWSTLFPIGGPQTAATNSFINPLPPNGQPLAKLHANLSPGSPFQQQASPQNHYPYRQQSRPQQAQQQFQGYFPQSLPQAQGHFGQSFHHQPQTNYQQYFSSGFQQSTPTTSPIPQEFNLFQQGSSQSFPQQSSQSFPQQSSQSFPQQSSQSFPQQSSQSNFQQSSQANFQQSSPQQSSFFNQIQEQPAAGQSVSETKTENFPSLPDLPFTADSAPFAPEPGFEYSHSTVSDPIKMNDYTMHMDLGSNSGGAEPSSAGSSVPMFGPMGRRLKKSKKSRQDISKKQGSDEAANTQDLMEASASTHQTILMASSLGSTSWTPLALSDSPKLEKKTLETPVSTTLQVLPQETQPQQNQVAPVYNPPQQHQQSPVYSQPAFTGSSAIFTAPAPALGPQDHKQDRTMILKKRRLSISGEVLDTQTVIPTETSSISSVPSSTTVAATVSTSSSTTTTVAPLTSSTTPAPVSSSSLSPSTVPESTSQSSPVITSTTVVSA